MIHKILIADDIAINRKIIKNILKKNMENLEFFEAEDGIAALDIIMNENIDLVILDLMMPVKNGYEVLKEIASFEGLKKMPVIINSAIDDMDSIKITLEMGALDYFTFPMKQEEISAILPLKVKNALNYFEQSKVLMAINEKNTAELLIAKSLQLSLMTDIKKFKFADMYGKYIPCDMVGGDLYDCIETGDSLWFLAADVAGHGLAAAMISTMVKGVFSNSIYNYSYPEEVLSNMNNLFYNMLGECSDYLVSAFIGMIRDNTLFYSNAGHPFPLIINCENKKIKVLEQNGYLLSIFKEAVYKSDKIEFLEGDNILLYTDGLFDLRDEDISGYWDRIGELTMQNLDLVCESPHNYIEMLINTFQKDYEKDHKDDISVMLICSKKNVEK